MPMKGFGGGHRGEWMTGAEVTKAVCAWETGGVETGVFHWPSPSTYVLATAIPLGLEEKQELRPRENQVSARPGQIQ